MVDVGGEQNGDALRVLQTLDVSPARWQASLYEVGVQRSVTPGCCTSRTRRSLPASSSR
ncbi:hypothetical protein [Frankia tisae]|uniref:hypothetical protein n=1 Tax=Frankia tisae TaxID=2950104 RepID=UPI0021C0DFD6|nr:hypothetical protein [Frankia tisae]